MNFDDNKENKNQHENFKIKKQFSSSIIQQNDVFKKKSRKIQKFIKTSNLSNTQIKTNIINLRLFN